MTAFPFGAATARTQTKMRNEGDGLRKRVARAIQDACENGDMFVQFQAPYVSLEELERLEADLKASGYHTRIVVQPRGLDIDWAERKIKITSENGV